MPQTALPGHLPPEITLTLALNEQATARIVSMYQAGLSIAEISERTGPSTNWVWTLLHKRGVQMRTRSEAAALHYRRRCSTSLVLVAWQRNQINVAVVIKAMQAL